MQRKHRGEKTGGQRSQAPSRRAEFPGRGDCGLAGRGLRVSQRRSLGVKLGHRLPRLGLYPPPPPVPPHGGLPGGGDRLSDETHYALNPPD